MTKESKQAFDGRFAREMAETADGMLKTGVIDNTTHRKITMRDLADDGAPLVEPLTGADIRSLRERAHMSQAVFARYLNLTVDHVSKLERGAKHPTGAALVLLNVIRRLGMQAVLGG
jgi:putative transcriptional regulator